MSVRSTASPIPGCDREPAVVGGLVEEHAIVASAGFHQAEALKDADRALVGIQGLSPDLLQAELVEAIVKACSPRPAPEPPAPSAPLADRLSEHSGPVIVPLAISSIPLGLPSAAHFELSKPRSKQAPDSLRQSLSSSVDDWWTDLLQQRES